MEQWIEKDPVVMGNLFNGLDTYFTSQFSWYISEELRKKGIETVLGGGSCVTIYSDNRFQSYDLDYVTYEDMSKGKKALKEIGFIEKQKYFKHTNCPWLIEFVSPPVAVGNKVIRRFNNVETPYGTIKMLKPVDSVKDRLANFYHWNDKQSLEQAISICLEQEINFIELEKWSAKEGHTKKFQIFKTKFSQKIKTKKPIVVRKAGQLQGKIIIAEDFDDPVPGF